MDIDVSLVSQLITTQFPHWSNLPIKPVELSGWDNRTFHLGEHMTVRLPSAARYASQVEKEHYWLPKLAPQLPLPIPVPLAMGSPSNTYPWAWSIYQWLDGETATVDRIADLKQFATTLAEFLIALQRIDASTGPAAGQHNFFRGGLLSTYDEETRQAIAALQGKIDTAAATTVWETALATEWDALPVWLHGDVSSGNLLIKNGQLSAVIDFGSSGVGDPACDLSIAWTLFHGQSREAFRKTLSLDNATWARGHGWTLWKALIVMAERGTSTLEVKRWQRVLNEVLVDHKQFA